NTLQPFRQILVPVTDPIFFHPTFQFRFVNKASINLNDDVWNLDYIRLDAGRNMYDTVIADVATTLEPSFLLNDYTAMPYRHFTANPSAELNSTHYFYGRNNYASAQSVVYGYTAREAETNTGLFSSSSTSATMAPYAVQQYSFPLYPVNFAAGGLYDKVVLEQAYYVSNPSAAAEPKQNDTIRRRQVFDNYLAYDDGTAERSYFLNQFATLPAKTAIEFHLNQPDTLRAVAIYFGRQVPLGTFKFFSLEVYKSIAFNGASEDLLYQQELLFASYADSINNFWVYRLDTPIALGAGTFYIGTTQPASSGSDSLYFGLDVNRIGGNHLYYNVQNFWESSAISGALMVRPMLGQQVFGTPVQDQPSKLASWNLYPNPSSGTVTVELDQSIQDARLEVFDMQGRRVHQSPVNAGSQVMLPQLAPGVYLSRIVSGQTNGTTRKLIIQ
ncbi:MAG: T9SS type A sorting domain-containing protein, partial [Sphingobacteriales bacterium]